MAHLMTEKEVNQQLMAAIKQAEDEGQPVHEIYKAIQAGRDVEITLEPTSTGKVQLIISA